VAGHSKWANIKHRKLRQDAAKQSLFTKLSREIIISAKEGAPDPEFNPRLRAAIQKARSEGMPNANIERAIERAIGGGEGAAMEEVVYEGYGPGGVGIIVKCLTDNRNRTVPELRHAFSKEGGNLAENGAVGWQFKTQGEVRVSQGVDEDALTLAALEAGAEDVQSDGDAYVVFTQPDSLHEVSDALEKQGFTILSAELSMNPTHTVAISREDASKLYKLLERLNDLEDVAETYFNTELPDDLD